MDDTPAILCKNLEHLTLLREVHGSPMLAGAQCQTWTQISAVTNTQHQHFVVVALRCSAPQS